MRPVATFVLLGLLGTLLGVGPFGPLSPSPVDAQVTIPTSTTTTTRPTTTTTRPPSTTTPTTQPGATTTPTTARRPPTTPPTTAPQRSTTTIPTPAPAPTTTASPVPLSKHGGEFSPVFTFLAVLGLMAGLGLLVLQWFLTKPGRQGWTL